ncbi:partial Beta-hexosaminidase A, partial [uncultured bacterium]
MIQLMHSFRGTTLPEAVREAVRRGEIAAFCLFNFNVVSPAQLRELTLALYAAAAEGGLPPPIIGMDQEGGQLIAVSEGTTELPGNMALGATRSPELAEQAGRVLGRELLAMGVNMNFAPSLDINNNPANPAIGIRSFGDDPNLVSVLGRALIRGIQAEGVIATAKHFPGMGDIESDSHFALPVVPHSL